LVAWIQQSRLVTGSVRFDGENKALEFLDENGVSVIRISYEKITGLQNVTKGVGPNVMIGPPSPKTLPSILNKMCAPCRGVSRREAHG